MRIDIVTLFPEMCENLLAESIIGRARARGHLQVCCHQLRRWGEGPHKRVDDCTFGGGKGSPSTIQGPDGKDLTVCDHPSGHPGYVSPAIP